ncbi:MAG: alpha/beta hydrolase [Bacteroidota bacterium]
MKNFNPSKKYIAYLIILNLVFCYNLLGQSNSIPTINQQKSHILKSKINNLTYYLNVSLPKHYSENDTSQYPVLYMLDGNWAFPIAHVARTSVDIFGGLENVIIVGIEYEWDKSFTPWWTNRWQDFTPTKDSINDENPEWSKIVGLPGGSLTSGGAPVFLNVIKNEIIPFIDEEYKTSLDRGISGHSLGGLFVSYCLFTNPDLFKKYGINSPSLWWDNKEILNIEKSYSDSHSALEADVFISVGGLESKTMISGVEELVDTLQSRNYQGLQITSHVFEGEDHISVMPAMISRTIKVLYSTEK